MSDRAELVANNSPRPAGILPDGELTYDIEDSIASAKWTVPIFWVSLFVEDDLKAFELSEIDSACLAPVTSLRKARLNWSRRRPRLDETFPHDTAVMDAWEEALARLKARYIKIDVTELYQAAFGLEEEEFLADLRGGVQWFDGGGAADFAHLLRLLWRRDAYNPATRSFTEKDDVPFMFYGHPWRMPPLKAD
jgi:hypothetical protein